MTQIPNDWHQLQKEVAKILEECGFRVEIEKSLQTVRGQVELDVHAEETRHDRTYSIVCECKRWQKRVAQDVVHSFRTVIGDIGANIGYIVSLKGFQTGAFRAAESTNVNLVTWEEFQNIFEQAWLEHYFVPNFRMQMAPLLEDTAYGVLSWEPEWIDNLSEDDKAQYLRVVERYGAFTEIVSFLTDEIHLTSPRRHGLPVKLWGIWRNEDHSNVSVPQDILNAEGYREFLAAAIPFGQQGIREYDALRVRAGSPRRSH